MMVGLRRALQLHSAVRPVKLYPGAPCALKETGPGIDFVVIRENLEGLYDYMNRRLLLANVKNDTEALDEVSGLLRELKEAWDAIPDPSRESTAYSAGEAVV